MNQSHSRIQPQLENEVNIYHELSSLPTGIADKITNAKTGGGRSLNAIHDSKTLNQLEKHLLLVLGSQMNFCKEFANQYRFISLNELAEKLSVNPRTVSALLNGVKRKGGYSPGLIEKGYVKKLVPTTHQQLKNHWKTDYCITSKIFDEYMISLIVKEKEAERKRKEKEAYDRGSEDPVIYDQRSSDPRSYKIPRIDPSCIDPSIPNIAAPKPEEEPKPPAALKNKKPENKKPIPSSKRKMKLWDQKSDEEKMDTLLNKAIDAHRLGLERRIANVFPFPFDDAPDLMLPIIETHKIEYIKNFFDYLKHKNFSCDIRKLDRALYAHKDEVLEWVNEQKRTD